MMLDGGKETFPPLDHPIAMRAYACRPTGTAGSASVPGDAELACRALPELGR
jgi:hypothetical protein